MRFIFILSLFIWCACTHVKPESFGESEEYVDYKKEEARIMAIPVADGDVDGTMRREMEKMEAYNYYSDKFQKRKFSELEQARDSRRRVTNAFSTLSHGSSPSPNTGSHGSCSSDYECGHGFACIKTGLQVSGSCAKVTDQYGTSVPYYEKTPGIKKAVECPNGICP